MDLPPIDEILKCYEKTGFKPCFDTWFKPGNACALAVVYYYNYCVQSNWEVQKWAHKSFGWLNVSLFKLGFCHKFKRYHPIARHGYYTRLAVENYILRRYGTST